MKYRAWTSAWPAALLAPGLLAAAPMAVSLVAAQVPPPQVLTPPSRIAVEPEPAGSGLVSRTMASADAQSFARAVAEAGHPAGFIMPVTERQIVLPPDSGAMVTLDDAIGVFTARGAYRAARHGRAVVFRHQRTPADVVRALEAVYEMPALKQSFSSTLFGTVLRSLARTRVGGTLGKEPAAGPECPVEQTVAIPAGRASMLDTLNALVTRTQGVAWLVRFGMPGENLRLQVGYVCRNGAWSALSVPGW